LMLDYAADHQVVVSVEDGLRIGGAGAAVRDALSERDADCRLRVLGVPTAYIPHGKADVILAELGLDAAGVASTVISMLES